MFTLLKLIKPFFLPPLAILIGMGIAFYLLVAKKMKWAGRILIVIMVSYYLLTTGPVTYLLVRSLERAVPRFLESKEKDSALFTGAEPEAIVILAGGGGRKSPLHPRPELSGPSWRRLWRGIELYREYGGRVPIIYSGGSGNPFNKESIEVDLARKYALSMGIPGADFWMEATSRNTYENVRETERLLDRKFPDSPVHRVILVTSTIHMPRAVLVMKSIGLDPLPEAADYPLRVLAIDPLSFLPSAGNFKISSSCIHEWIGIIAYRLMGRL